MNLNPFATKTFASIWSKHFNQSKQTIKFNFLNHILFAKHNKLPLYYNVGNKFTNGNFYKINDDEADFKNKTFLIRDIPSYHKINELLTNGLKRKAVFQYQGYTTKISNYNSLDDYLRSIYKSNSRSKFRRNIKRLEACFDVEYVMYFGEISDTTYHSVFNIFYELFEKRYSDKGEPCGELDPKIWAYYTELGLALIREKKASLFVIYCDEIPVGITFSYHIDNILIETLTVFDIDYYRFNIGHTMILKMLEWSFQNDIKLFDYTQGDFDYKKRWSDSQYNTFYHIIYDSNSLKSNVLAASMNLYFNAKRKFRELKLNNYYHKFKYKLFGKHNEVILSNKTYHIELLESKSFDASNLKRIDISEKSFSDLRRSLFDFLYMNPEKVNEITFFALDDNTVFAKGKNNVFKISVENDA